MSACVFVYEYVSVCVCMSVCVCVCVHLCVTQPYQGVLIDKCCYTRLAQVDMAGN